MRRWRCQGRAFTTRSHPGTTTGMGGNDAISRGEIEMHLQEYGWRLTTGTVPTLRRPWVLKLGAVTCRAIGTSVVAAERTREVRKC